LSVFRGQPDLLRAFREGRRDALETVYRAHVRAVDRYLRALARRCGDHALAQTSTIADLLQEVFVRAFSDAGRNGYDGIRDYAPYLTSIARNCFVDAQRARGREVPTPPDDLSLAVDCTFDTADAEPGWCEPRVLEVLAGYLRDLGPEISGVYEQRFVLGRSQESACEALGMTRRSLRTAENHLRRGLRKALSRAGISLRELGEPPEENSTRIAVPSVKLRSQS
jgi:RNA polymerase sigma factor (sigma-70 family)